MKFMLSFFIVATAFTAGAAETTTTTTTTTVATASTPTAVCQAIVDSAKNKDFEGMKKWMTEMGPHHGMQTGSKKGQKEAFLKMESEHFDTIKDLTCGTELLANDHAVVMSESKGEKRLIPFIKQNNSWKFDVHTYHSFYADESHGKHHKM